MNFIAAAAGKALNKLDELEVPHALVGGLAVSARAEPRFTQDVDIAIAVRDDDEAEAVVRAFSQSGFFVVATVEQEATDRLSTARLLSQSEERRRDADDLGELRKVATGGDIALAREAVGLIEERGYNRGRDLGAALDELVVGPEGA